MSDQLPAIRAQAALSAAASRSRREQVRDRRLRFRRLRAALALPALTGIVALAWLITEPLPSPILVAVSIVLIAPFLATFDWRLYR